MKRSWVFGLSFLALGAALAHGDPLEVRRVTLKNGLLVLLAPDSRAAAVDVAVWYRAGTRYEPAGTAGITHLLGRLMFHGSRGFPAGEHQRLLRAEGASFNFVANPDYSCFHQALPAEAVELALKLEADRMRALEIGPEALEAERAAVLDERRRRLGVGTVGRGLQRLYAVVFEGHPYGRPVLGLEEDLRGVTLDQVRSYYGRYSPQNAVLTVVGLFDPDQVMATIRRHWEPIPGRASSPAPAAKPKAQHSERRASEAGPFPAPILLVGWRGPGEADPDSPALELLSRLLWGNPSVAVRDSLVGPGRDFSRVEGDLDRTQEASLLYCVASARPGADTAAAERELIRAVERLAREPLTADQLGRNKRQAEAATLSGWQTVRGRADAIGRAQLLAGTPDARVRLERIRALTPADVQRIAARVLAPSSRTVVWLTPDEAFGGASESGEVRR